MTHDPVWLGSVTMTKLPVANLVQERFLPVELEAVLWSTVVVVAVVVGQDDEKDSLSRFSLQNFKLAIHCSSSLLLR